jgi:hypothetical protein
MTPERLREVLEYSPDSGLFVWRVRLAKNVGPGQIAGCLRPDGYIGIRIDGVRYMAHRLAWFYMTGTWPKEQIDHKNCIKDDNRWVNLREANRSQNGANHGRLLSRNKSGLKGVSWSKASKRWRAQGRYQHLGWFATKEEAAAAYAAWAKENYGDFAYEQ